MTVGTTQNLSDGGAQALQALVKSISPEVLGSTRDGDELTPEQTERLSKKLTDLLGEGESDNPVQHWNEVGKGVVNEEGLPIIEITEPLPNSDFPTLKEQSVTIEGPNLVPLASLTQSERDHLRAERDRILDFLEKQEKEDQRKEEEREQNEIREDVQRRKAAVKFEPDKLKAAKEMQKKMGKALLKSMESDRQKQEKIQEEVSTGEPSQGPPVKRVRFAKERTENVDWGDVTPATLEPMNKNTLITKSRMQKNQVMKDVVERLPPGVLASQSKVVDQGDSDDESNPDSAVPSYSDDDSVIQPLDNNEDLGSNSSVDKESESFDLEEEYDMDVARHQREIALEYYEKRGIIGKNVSKSLESTTEVLDTTMPSTQSKPSISRFKANRLASAYNTSLPSVLSAVASNTARDAIQMGKLDGDQLVGGNSDASGSEDEAVKEALGLLTRGDTRGPHPELGLSSSPLLESTDQDKKIFGFKPGRSPTSRSPITLDAVVEKSSALPCSSHGVEHRSSLAKRQFKPTHPHRFTARSQANEVDRIALKSPTESSSVMTSQLSNSTTRMPESIPEAQFPIITDSPSFRPPEKLDQRLADDAFSSVPHNIQTPRIPDRPPEVLSPIVRDSSNESVRMVPHASRPQQRVSRFKAERMS